MTPKTISQDTFRQFILGQQGLWPGRRWQAKAGVQQALLQCQAIQVDPVTVISPSHDLVMHSRVAGYQPSQLDELLHTDRKAFAYGTCLYIYPIEDLPAMRAEMNRAKAYPRYQKLLSEQPQLFSQVLSLIEQNGPTRSRGMQGNAVKAYRSSKDSGLAMYYLWLTGSLMMHSRAGRDRVYDLTERIAPAHLQHSLPDDQASLDLSLKNLKMLGLANPTQVRNAIRTTLSYYFTTQQATEQMAQFTEEGKLYQVKVEGHTHPYYYASEEADTLDDLASGKLPPAWAPIGATTTDEVSFLSPLEYVSARGRARSLFNFEYIWEIYKPASQRKYGPYTLPILYGDRLVGRMDARSDRASSTLVVNGIWLEAGFESDQAFENATNAGLKRLADFLQLDNFTKP